VRDDLPAPQNTRIHNVGQDSWDRIIGNRDKYHIRSIDHLGRRSQQCRRKTGSSPRQSPCGAGMHRYNRITDTGHHCSQRRPYPANADDPDPQFLCHDHRPNRMLSTETQVSPELVSPVATDHVPTADDTQKRDPRTRCRIDDSGSDRLHEQSPTYSARSASYASRRTRTELTLTLSLPGRCSPVQ
jgi:hypothetical protein